MPDARPRLRLHVVQAAFGDALLLEARSAGGVRRVLVDGGPGDTYSRHLRPLLASIAATGGTIDVAMLSHIDNDHVAGLLDLFDELRNPPPGASALPGIAGLWHNSFSQAVGSASLEPVIRAALKAAGRFGAAMPELAIVLRGVSEGDALHNAAIALRVPINPGFRAGHVLVGAPPVELGDLRLHVVGPSRAILEQLRDQWTAWLRRQRAKERQRGAAAAAAVAVAADRSIPNLSSIVVLASLGRRSVLLTGDARGDHVLEGLRDAGLLDADGRLHVSVLKLPHHGSIRNVSRALLDAVRADTYLVSADGRYGNPDHEALALVVESARDAGREIELLMTNPTPGADELARTHPARRFGYRVRRLRTGSSVLALDVRAVRPGIPTPWTS